MSTGDDPPVGTRPTVLCVDDSAVSRLLMTRALQQRPHLEVITADRGAEALELAAEHLPSLILMDGWLPDLTGVEVIRLLKERPATREIPVVVITGDDRAELHREMRAVGAADCIVKPISLDRLFELVDRYLPAPTPDEA